jgi:hypothetical protein
MLADVNIWGLNLEDMRLTIAHNLNMLLAVVAIGIAWSTRVASILYRQCRSPAQKHGYKAKSWVSPNCSAIAKFLSACNKTRVPAILT